jgi:RNase P subunit RPR2
MLICKNCNSFLPNKGFIVSVDRHIKFDWSEHEYKPELDKDGNEIKTVTLTCKTCGYIENIKSVNVKDGDIEIAFM